MMSMLSNSEFSVLVARPRIHSLKSPRIDLRSARCAGRGRRTPAAAPGSGARARRCRDGRCRRAAAGRRRRRDRRAGRPRGSHVCHDRSYWLWWAIGNRLRTTLPNRWLPQMAHRRHHPAHAERGADLLGLAGAAGAGADHLLQRDDVGVDRAQDLDDARRHGAAIHAAAAVDVVGGDPHVDVLARRFCLGHCCRSRIHTNGPTIFSHSGRRCHSSSVISSLSTISCS